MKKLRKITFEETGRRAHDSGVVYAIVIVIPFIVGLLGIGDLYIAALVFAFVATAINEADIQRRNGESLWTTIWCSLIAGLSLTTLAILSGLFGIMASMRWVTFACLSQRQYSAGDWGFAPYCEVRYRVAGKARAWASFYLDVWRYPTRESRKAVIERFTEGVVVIEDHWPYFAWGE